MDENTTSLPYEEIQPIQGAILGIIATPGIIGNIFAIVATVRILREQKLSPNIFVLSLAVIDLFGIVIICIPTWLCYAFGGWIGGDKLCDFQGFMTLFCSLGSGGIATSMAVDRYLAVKAPFWHRRTVTARLATRVVLGVYLGSALISCLPVVGFGSFVLNLTSTYCTLNWFATELKDVVFSYLFATIGVLLIFTVIFCNINVIVRLLQRKEKTRALSAQNDRDEQQRATTLEKQFSRMMIVISTIFLICWVPFMVRIISNISRIWINWSADLQASRLLLLNLVLDPFTYVLTRQQYRQALRYYCCCYGTRKTTRSASTLTVSSVRSSRSSSLVSNFLYNVRRSEPPRIIVAAESPTVFKKCKGVEAGVPSSDDKSVIGLKYTKRFSLRKKKLKVENVFVV